MKTFKGRTLLVMAIAVIAIVATSCSKNEENMVSQDSLDRAIAERDSIQNALKSLNGYLDDISFCVDSIASQEGILLNTVNPETGKSYSRNEIRERIEQFGSLIERQRAKIAELTEQLKNSGSKSEIERLTNMITYLNAQLQLKEDQMNQLRAELASSRRSVSELTQNVTTLTSTNAVIKEENKALDRQVAQQTEKINEGYFLAADKKKLEEMGLIQKGGFLKKSKTDLGNADVRQMTRVDMRHFNDVPLKSKKEPKLLSQAPKGSYVFEKNGKDSWTFIITDTAAFWSLSDIVIIQLN